ncbi:MAG: glycosyltransferase [bacterium]|nr:glycosyltransferase [bacterium]
MSSAQKIVVLSEDLSEPWDEGIKKFAYCVGKALKTLGDVLMINVDRSGVGGETVLRVPGSRTFLSRPLSAAIRGHEADRIYYVPSPSNTTSSFGRAAVLRRIAPAARIGMVALIPRELSPGLLPLLRWAAPDVIWVPSYRSLLRLSRARIPGEVLPVGYDCGVFSPATSDERTALREKYAVPREAFVALHVGHIRPKRNLGALTRMCALEGVRVIVIGSTSTPEDNGIRARLESAGAHVIREFVDVAEFYRLADCYVFPVRDTEGCVEMPLSIVEALASGLPVLSTAFGGVRDFLLDGPDVVYWEQEDELLDAVGKLMANGRPKIRNMNAFAWEHIAATMTKRLSYAATP